MPIVLTTRTLLMTGMMLIASLVAVRSFAGDLTDAPVSSEEEEMPPAPSERRSEGTLIVDTTPRGAAVYAGRSENEANTFIGETPLELSLPAGFVFLRVTKEGFAEAVGRIDVRPNEDNWMQIRLEKDNADRRSGLKLAGNLLLWPGLLAAGTGIGLIVAGNRQGSYPMAKTGYGIAAAGVAMTISGGIILGLTYRQSGVYTMPSVASRGTDTYQKQTMFFLIARF